MAKFKVGDIVQRTETSSGLFGGQTYTIEYAPEEGGVDVVGAGHKHDAYSAQGWYSEDKFVLIEAKHEWQEVTAEESEILSRLGVEFETRSQIQIRLK